MMGANPGAALFRVKGIVQGVGFRPFVLRLAKGLRLSGDVANTQDGVVIRVEGAPENIAAFASDLTAKAPPLAHVLDIQRSSTEVLGARGFFIRKSESDGPCATLISPDVAVCGDCLAELFDPMDRRFRYPFINCTHCGPRFTIISGTPYDRPKTSMARFAMCPDCRAEYEDPQNRRFHAQPNACPVCGPSVSLADGSGKPVACRDPIAETARLLKQGAVVAIKGLGGFHLAVDATSGRAVGALRERKRREEKPLALMSPDMEAVARYAYIRPDEERVMKSPQRPIVLLEKKQESALSGLIAPGNRFVGAMLPYTPLHHLLLAEGFTALVMSSGNLSEEPIAKDNAEALDRLGSIADYFLMHDRDILLRCDDSVARVVAGSQRMIRRSRGYVPLPVFLKNELSPILGCGAMLKNTLCLASGNHAFLSQHIGDLENLASFLFLSEAAAHLEQVLEIKPEALAHDLHPDYLSTRYALERTGLPRVAVQHHHAHAVSCMAENRVTGPVIAVSADGAGLGEDGAVWGGEILIAEEHRFDRAAHIEYVPMPGAAAAIKEPWRMAISYLFHAFGEEFPDLAPELLPSIGMEKINAVASMIRAGINCPPTSSLGRLFDGVAAILGLRDRAAFEGQAAMELEAIAADGEHEPYAVEWETVGKVRRVVVSGIIRAVVDDARAGVPAPVIAARFHETVIAAFSGLCTRARAHADLDRVVLSGGSFQNARLVRGLTRTLQNQGFTVYNHALVPANDGGISLGQAVAAAAMLKKGTA